MQLIGTILVAACWVGALSVSASATDAVAVSTPTMSGSQLEAYFERLKRGTPIELTLENGKIVRGLYGSYDDYYETVWIVPRGERGAFSQKGFKLTGIRNAVPWERKTVSPPPPTPSTFTPSLTPSSTPLPTLEDDLGKDEYYLIKQN